MGAAERPVSEGYLRSVADLDRRLGVMETRFVRLAGNPVVLGDTVLTASAASITFSDIPQNFSHLQLKYDARSDAAFGAVAVVVRINGDSSLIYDDITMLASAAAAPFRTWNTGAAFMSAGQIPAANANAGVFGGTTGDIVDYSSNLHHKSVLTTWGSKIDTAGPTIIIGVSAGWWRSTDPVTSVTVFPYAGNFISGSRIALIGVP